MCIIHIIRRFMFTICESPFCRSFFGEGVYQTMELNECLEQRVTACTIFPDCTPLRFSVLVWDENDSKANILCEKVKKRGSGDTAFVSVKAGEDAYKILSNHLARTKEKQKINQQLYPSGNYLLVVATTQKLCDAVNVSMLKQHFQDTIIEFCNIVEFGISINETIEKKNINITAEWRIDEDEARVISILLAYAAYEKDLLSNYLNIDPLSHPVLEVRSKEYSTVREAICRQSLALLDKQMISTESLADNIRLYLSMEKYRSIIMKNCPKPEWLPILEYEEFIKELLQLKKKKLKQRLCIIHRPGTNGENISLTVNEAICKLFGKEGQEPRTEWLRKTIKSEIMSQICDNTVNKNQDKLKNILKSYFSLYDIQHQLILEIQKCGENAKASMEKYKNELSKELSKEYSWKSLKPGDLLNGFHRYYALWKKWIEACAEVCWWNSIGNLLLEIKEQTAGDYNNLKNAKEMLQGLCIGGMASAPTCCIDNENKNILTNDSLKEFIRHILYTNGFESRDIIGIIKASDKKYADGTDFHVNVQYRPTFFLLSNKKIIVEEPLQDLNFQWKHIPCRYVPESVLYELKIYLRAN